MDGSAVWPVKNKWANYNINPDAARLPSSQEFPNRKAALATHNQKKAGNKGPVEHAEIEERLRDLVPCKIVVQEFDIVHFQVLHFFSELIKTKQNKAKQSKAKQGKPIVCKDKLLMSNAAGKY